MRTSKFITTIASILMITGFIGCSDDSGNPAGKTADHADTSIFIGTWVEVIDTAAIPGKSNIHDIFNMCEDNTCPLDTIEFANDSLLIEYGDIDLEFFYNYSKDSLFIYWDVIDGSKELEKTTSYKITNDTLVFSAETLYVDTIMQIHIPTFYRIPK